MQVDDRKTGASGHAVEGLAEQVRVDRRSLGAGEHAFTMTVYQHVLPGMQAEAATTFADLVFGPE